MDEDPQRPVVPLAYQSPADVPAADKVPSFAQWAIGFGAYYALLGGLWVAGPELNWLGALGTLAGWLFGTCGLLALGLNLRQRLRWRYFFPGVVLGIASACGVVLVLCAGCLRT